MNLLISSILFLAGMECLYASMSPMPYVVEAIGALAVMQPEVQRMMHRLHRRRLLLMLAGVVVGAIIGAIMLSMFGAPMYAREIAFAIMILAGMHFFEKVQPLTSPLRTDV
jgi:uncharacterized membrane protein YfcA